MATSTKPTSLADKIVHLHDQLEQHSIPHAFGGALALAWCTQQARGTIDIDINIFLDPADVAQLLEALPKPITWSDSEEAALTRDGQVRLWWDSTPVDVFMNTTLYHDMLAQRIRVERFNNGDIPFLGCDDVAVFKAFFNRTKDWADIEAMIDINSVDTHRVLGVLVDYLGPTDERVERLRGLMAESNGAPHAFYRSG